jgi:ATP-dependent DNA helicase RecG
LKLRGPGEFLGTKQSGLPEFFIGNLLDDFPLMEECRKSAFRLVEKDPNLDRPEHRALREHLAKGALGFSLMHVS